MDRLDGIARLLLIPAVIITGALLFSAADREEPVATVVLDEAVEAGGDELPLADVSVPPAPPTATWQDGAIVLRGSVQDTATGRRYADRLASVVGPGNVTTEMTLHPEATAETMTIDLGGPFPFPAGAELGPELTALSELGATVLPMLPESTLVVTAHTDAVGGEATNLALSQVAAQRVADSIVQRGVPAERVVARGAGESAPRADNATPEGRAANRRIDAVLEGVTPG